MRLFNLFFNFENPVLDTATLIAYTIFTFFLVSIFFLIGVSILSLGGFFFLLEIGTITFFLLFGVDSVSKFQLPIPFISRKHNYFSMISDYSAETQGVSTEDFFPPFMFGYRNYFLSKASRWWDFWSPSLEHINRRISSSIFEWGYRKRVPNYHYYVVRGGERIKRLISNNFKRVTGTTHDSPIWFYTFGARRRAYGWSRGDWGEYRFHFHSSLSDAFTEKLFFRYKRIRVRNLHLSNWLEKWSVSINPKVINSDYFLSGNKASPYSYDKFSFKFLRFSNINFIHKRTEIGFQSHITDPQAVARNDISRRMNRFIDYVQTVKPNSMKFPTAERKLSERGGYVLLDMNQLFYNFVNWNLAKYYVTPYIIVSGKRNNAYWHSQYWRTFAYNSLIEFWTFIFESLYIYPFQTRWTNTQISFGDKNFRILEYVANFNFFEYFEYLLTTGLNIYWVTLLFLYFIIFFAVFKTCVSLLRAISPKVEK